MTRTENTIKVWDPVVRIGHWVVVLAFFVAYFTEDDFMQLHVWAGYVVGAVVCFRLIWGFIGSEHARFADFVRSPAAILRYLRDLKNKTGKHYLGHNPLGGAMILALLLCVAVTVYSGLALYAVEENAGPLAALMARTTPPAELSVPHENAAASEATGKKKRKAEDPREEFWEEIHEVFANVTVALVVLHVLGGLLSSYMYRENLIKSMVTGTKRAD